MTLRPAPLHVYEREISDAERSSLSVLANLIRPGAKVLDLGCGSGGLGRYLRERRECTLDGVTLSPDEAALARPSYRRVEVANLEHCDLPSLFAGELYDQIVCADVLEHLSAPERTLDACRQLLAPGGELLISIPNAAYAGLVAELLHGEFTYRDEGLLDRTHLRFFTRQSLSRFLQDHGWGLQALDTIQRPLHASEFKADFDQLPPGVAAYLLAVPDALTYQFIARARPGVPHAHLPAPASTREQALFTPQLYLGDAAGYDEERKVETVGVVGEPHQTIRFRLPAEPPFVSLKFDPAERPGFLHLHAMRLRHASGHILWRWTFEEDGMAALRACRHAGMLLHGEEQAGQGALVLLTNDDPWLELPPAAPVDQAAGGCLEVDLGWPMSADYLALSQDARQLQEQIDAQRAAQQRAEEDSRNAWRVMREQHRTLLAQRMALSEQIRVLQEQYQGLQQGVAEVIQHRDAVVAHRDSLVQHLQNIEASTSYRATRPLVRWNAGLQRRLRHLRGDRAMAAAPAAAPQNVSPPPTAATEPAHQPEPATPSSAAAPSQAQAVGVDVIVPVYRGLADTQRCIRSVLAHAQRTDWQLVVINDASPEIEVTNWLREAARNEPRITLLENGGNAGFVATVNRGMLLNPQRDVVLLNSDAEVANDWLDRLSHAAYAHGKVATVTPFSNNATICSYPRFCAANPLPEGYDTAKLDALFAASNAGEVLDVPTGIGFCMYIRRDCLNQIGLFDVVSFGTGYGEENDFCLRAAAAGWRNLHALDVFVRHTGGTSFGASKSDRELAAMDTLRLLHPDYERQVHAYVAADPAQSYRVRVDMARLRASPRPLLLMVMHGLGGGTLRHVEELTAHLSSRALSLYLLPGPSGQIMLRWPDPREPFELYFRCPEEVGELAKVLRAIGIRHIHFHHLHGHDAAILELPGQVGVPYDFTAHDYHTVCPQISLTPPPARMYCGELGVEQCRNCLAHAPAPTGESIESWRARHGAFLQRARYVLAPSRDAARRLARYLPAVNVRFAPHTDVPSGPPLPQPQPFALPPHAPLRVLVVGALSQIKGADVLEATAIEAARTNSPLEFHLAGYPYRPMKGQPHASLAIHGPYAESDLQLLLRRLVPDVVWFPAQWPETYSYTLSACLRAGTAIVAPDLGAFAERLSGRDWTWLRPWSASAAEWVAFFVRLRDEHFIPQRAPGPAPAFVFTALDAQMGSWSYDADYLQGLPALVAPSPALPDIRRLLAIAAPPEAAPAAPSVDMPDVASTEAPA